jgi:tRNA 2-thiocytidine biosynthesis protein TtcA
LLDPKLYDFKNLKTTGIPDPDGDKAFDHEPVSQMTAQPIAFY